MKNNDMRNKFSLIKRLGGSPLFVMEDDKMVLVDTYVRFEKYVHNYFNGAVNVVTKPGKIILQHKVCYEVSSCNPFIENQYPSDLAMIYRQGMQAIVAMSLYLFYGVTTKESLEEMESTVEDLATYAFHKGI